MSEHILKTLFLLNFYVLILKKYVLAVSQLTVTLRMFSDSRRSASVINSRLPTDQAGGRFADLLSNEKQPNHDF
jgi:hypothetical protein